MDKILTLVDGSIYSESVCHHAAWIAARLKAGVELLHVLGRREGVAGRDLSGALSLGARTALLQELARLDEEWARLAQARGHAILEDAKAIIERDGVEVVSARLRKGDLLDAVREVERDIRAIILGKRGEGADFASGHLGSNLERIVRSSTVPVFVASREFTPISRVLVAYDGSASARTAIQRMSVSPVFSDLEICVLCVGKDMARAQATAEEGATTLRAANIKAMPRAATGEPEEVLSRMVAEDGFNLLVMGAYGHSRIRNLIIGSTTTAMIQTVRIPVLLYR